MTDGQKTADRANEKLIRDTLESAGTQFRGKICRCPFHQDRHASAGIYFKNGAWHFHCHVCAWGGDVFDVRAKLSGRPLAEELGCRIAGPIEKPKKTYATLEDALRGFDLRGCHHYQRDGKTHCIVARFWKSAEQRKGILQLKPIPGGYIFSGPTAPHPLYQQDSIMETTREVIVVEGERKVEELRLLGFCAVTSLGGAGKAEHSDWSALAGRNIYLWADADQPTEQHPDGVGVEHMRAVAKILATLKPSPRVHRICHEDLDLPDGGDVVDFIARYKEWDRAELSALIRDEIIAKALPAGISADYLRHIEDGIAGKRRPWCWPWPMLNDCRALTPGTVTVLCGDPKCGKSLLLTQCLLEWSLWNVPACIYELEDGRNYHLARAHAQLAKEGRLLDPHWLEGNADAARVLTETAMTEIEAVGNMIWEGPTGESATYAMLLAWIEQRAKDGFKIIVIDPVTAARPEAKPWVADHDFIHAAKRIAEQYRVCPVIVIHPTKGHKGGGGGSDLSGGAAMSRFCHTLLWLDVVSSDTMTTVRDRDGLQSDYRVNRSLRVVFARNGPGSNRKIALDFNWQKMCFSELGEIVT